MTESNSSHSRFSWLHGPSLVPAPEPSLAAQAMVADQQSRNEVDLALIWRELVQGLAVVVGGFFDAKRCGLVLTAVGSRPALDGPLNGRLQHVLEAVLCGSGQKTVAIELDLAPSTVALNIRAALERLGVTGKPSRVHPLLMLAATAARQHALVPASASHFTRDGVALQVIGLPRPELALAGQMPTAELDVVRALVEGRAYAEIASTRGTSARTVANQIAGAFRRLQVSGRSELLQRLFVLSGWLRSFQSPVSSPPETARLPRTPARESLVTGIQLVG